MSKVYQIEGMHCEACAANIQRRLETIPGVTAARVSFQDKSARVDVAPDGGPADAQIQRVVEEAGYKVAGVQQTGT